jgi:CRISPR-associated endoribonuclease Cas6
MVLRMTPLGPPAGPLGEAHTGHAAFLNLIRRADPVLSAALHSGSERRPFTISPCWAAEQRQTPDGNRLRAPWLRITLLRSDLFAGLRGLFLKPRPDLDLRLGGQIFRPTELLLSPEASPWAGHASYQVLGLGERATRVIGLHFATPTSFSLGQRAWGRRMELLPRPDFVFDSLWRKWNAFAPEPFGPEVVQVARDQVVLSQLEGATREIRFPRAPQLGFVGRCTYGIKGQVAEPVLRALNALADFAFYAGVGYKTTMGMGQTRRLR